MPSNLISSVENNFTKGLITESTGLNFPENAATECDNTLFTVVGETLRREGFDFEDNFTLNTYSTANSAINTYKWNNVGGDGQTQFMAVQVGSRVLFFSITAATSTVPLSANLLASQVDLTAFVVSGVTFSSSIECTFSDGNGYLFIFNSQCSPIYCAYNSATNLVTATAIDVKVRDFNGIPEITPVNTRPTTLSQEHLYNLTNQGWTSGSPWWGTSNTAVVVGTGSKTFTTALGMTVTNGDLVNIIIVDNSVPGGGIGTALMSGTVTGYVGGTGVITINASSAYASAVGQTGANWVIQPTNRSYINSWFTAEGNYPSNSDVWWYFRNNSNVFDPTIQANVSLSSGNAPQGHYLLSAFNQDRSLTSGISGLTAVTTTKRPDNGCWFQGRVWYTGVSDSQQASGDAAYYTWSENIYFSQINVGTAVNFGSCYQENDPTSDRLFDILPTDGGIIQIQGSGRIFKLFPIQNGMLVFAANGIWFITGSQGIGFTANDYTITKISAVESISRHSYVDVMGLPYFWNEEDIYQVSTAQSGGLSVNPITVGTILSFYNIIPKQSKKFVRGVYNPVDYVIQWIYKSTNDVSVTDRYSFDKILNYNVYNKSFFPYTINNTSASIKGINYVQGPGGSTSPDPAFKYFCATGTGITFAEENDDTFVDWSSTGTPVNYISYFITGYKLHGKGQFKFQIPYIYVYSKMSQPYISYFIQGLWDYATSSHSGDYTTKEFVELFEHNRGVKFRKHRIRGRGLTLQLKLSSVDRQPFDFIGWSVYENVNTGI